MCIQNSARRFQVFQPSNSNYYNQRERLKFHPLYYTDFNRVRYKEMTNTGKYIIN